MSQCIYCRSELNQNDPPDDMTCSEEHIVPYALGGSSAFTTNDASRKCNSDLGFYIDSKFINLLPFAIKRHTLKLAGRSGIIPPIVWPATSLDNGKAATITIHEDGRAEYDFHPTVVENRKEGREERLIAGSRDRVRSILAGMLAKASEKGQVISTSAGEQIAHPDDFEQHFEIEETEVFHASIKTFDSKVWVRGVFKILLGLGHVILGPDWTFSADGGDRIRTVLVCDRKLWPAQSLKGFSAGALPPAIHALLGITPAVRAANHHTLAILPQHGETLAVVSLFGGSGVPEALVSLGTEAGNLAVANDMMNPHTRVGVRIDPTTRRTTWISVADVNQAAVRLA